MELTADVKAAVAKGDMIMMESLRSFTLQTTKGHAVRFTAREPRPVPKIIAQEAMAQGCVPINKEDTPFLDDMSKAKVEFDRNLRRAILFIALDAVCSENDTSKFAGSGVPKEEVIEEMTSISVQKKELGKLMDEYRNCKSTGSEMPTHPAANEVYAIVQAENKDDLLELAKEAGYPVDKAAGLVSKDLRRMLIAKHVIGTRG